jgi:hypothetical protein
MCMHYLDEGNAQMNLAWYFLKGIVECNGLD